MSRKVIFLKKAQKHFDYFQKHNSDLSNKIIALLEDVVKNPFHGIGKPEPLKFELSGLWSRRINQEHRLVYKVEKNLIIVVICKYHY